MYKGVFTIVNRNSVDTGLKILKHPKIRARFTEKPLDDISERLKSGKVLVIEQTNYIEGGYHDLETYWELFDEYEKKEMHQFPEGFSIKVSPDEFIEALNELLEV